MSSGDSIEARQNNEFEALQAIYGFDLKDLRKKAAWNKWTPMNLSLSLKPQQGSVGTHEIYATIDLHIVCDACYPENCPRIYLENSKGLSQTTVAELQVLLEQKSKELEGEEMIFQLAQCVEEFLHTHNKPTSKSFYDEMLKRQKEKEERDLQARQIEQDLKRQYMIEEVQRRQEILKSEIRQRRENIRQNSENDDDFDTRRPNSSADSCDEPNCDHKGIVLMDFSNREIQRGSCIRHSSRNHISFSGIDTESGDLVIVDEWNIPVGNKDFTYMQRQISSIEQEMNYLTRLRHRNLVKYYNIKYYFEGDVLKVFALREFVYGSNCSSLFLSPNVKVDLDQLKYIAKGTLIALDYLHRNNVVHKDIRDSCIYLSDSGHIKISNYSIHRRLYDLLSQTHNNYSKKTDILKFGELLLSLLQGNVISDLNVEVPTSLQSDLYDFLTRCLSKEESTRSTAAQLLNHVFFQNKRVVQFTPKQGNEEVEVQRNTSPEIVLNELQSLSQMSSGQSRINNEFEFLQHLGKGAYGDVIKVRNKLDGGYYAIKRIQLNPKNKSLNKKIVREVKLLSRLNHENVVRYYNSWIETTTIKEEICTSTETSTCSTNDRVPVIIRKDEFTIDDNIEALAPSIKNVEVSITYDGKSQAAFDSSSDNSTDDEEEWGVVFNEDSDYDIEFEHNTGSESKSSSSSVDNKDSEAVDITSPEIVKQIDFMYIQMEFCEKSTLRTAIDDNLYLNEDRMWRLFREIVEGLAHIHQQGMIHRDLKPVNIFLDSEDHVKIGDFGLATTNIKSKQFELSKSAMEMEKENNFDESRTGNIGTALYAAPEISTSCKVVYNQKVDIYSLGIILFEMCYKPLTTSMERIKILTKSRLPEIVLPEEFANKKNERQVFLIKWLLNHDISKRPTSQELLLSEHIPPPVLEERELQELVRHTLNNTQLKGYKYLIASCFEQPVTPVQDITYDKDPFALTISKPVQIYDYVRGICEKIFKQHGGQNLSTPLLMPKSKFYDHLDSCVKLMTHSGGIVTLPYDLRVPFARYVAWNAISLLRRYSIERVYREKKVFGFQPRELYECAFDIVSPTSGTLMSDAELLYIGFEIINELPVVKNKHFVIRLNHTALITAILLHFGIKDKHQEVFKMISDVKEGKVSKYNMQNYLISFGLPDNSIHLLINLLNSELEISKCVSHFQMITKKKQSEASQLARQALQDLKLMYQNAVAYGVTGHGTVAQFIVWLPPCQF
ncbi:unnamed protein product [Acanthoscelides obtectus]|uniref:non-specific serine/threonine protein kinase n=2 Tax=Acanthoscelides obtectus TaxID=200917 RepID=A0A9P0PDU5_ACAOB|nr:unnamed protein product [Acanthoscelides obtectus]CAK1672033.1 eIF-2-alpha kinase GCN2 [Acanthoscelides obtectus]